MYSDANAESLATRIKARYELLCRRRQPWRNIWSLLSKYILLRPFVMGAANTIAKMPRFSVADVSDDEVIEAARTSATALGGALWPHAGESFEFVPIRLPGQLSEFTGDLEADDVKAYAESATQITRDILDAPETGFTLAWNEHLDEQPVFGTSGVYGEDREDDDITPVQFSSITVEDTLIDEGADKLINTIYREFVYTPAQLAEKFGVNALSPATREALKNTKDDTYVKVIQAIEPRPGGKKSTDVPVKERAYRSVYLEVEACHVLKESGIDEMPAWVVRFRKRPNEIYGRSLGMDALPSVKELNILRSAFSKALGKQLDPPMGYYHEMIGGGGKVNTSMGARVPLYMSGRLPHGQKPIEPLFQVPEPRVANERIEKLVERIAKKFLIDRLLDFNNKTRMTLGEAELRNDFRNQALGNIFARQIGELLNPLIKWTFRTLYRRGFLGISEYEEEKIALLKEQGLEPLIIPRVIVDLMDRGIMPFAIRFISPAARAMKAESLLGLEKSTNYAFTFANAGMPEVMDNLDTDEAYREYHALSGASSRTLRSPDKVKKVRRDRSNALAKQQELAAAQVQADTGVKTTQAVKNLASAEAANNG